MATYEKRKNVEGQVTAIRVKIRRVGLPHLSQTFPLENGSQTALKKAEQAAKIWADEVTKSLAIKHGNFILNENLRSSFNRSSKSDHRKQSEPVPVINFKLDAFKRHLSQLNGDMIINNGETSEERILAALLLDCGLALDEIKQMRWQHIRINRNAINVLSQAGLTIRQAKLTQLTLDALLASKRRKYGILFLQEKNELQQLVPAQLTKLFGKTSQPEFIAGIKREAAHRMADRGMNEMQICQQLGIGALDSISSNDQHRKSNTLKDKDKKMQV